MVWSGFRPSDDACTFGYLIPANMFAVVTLGELATLAREVFHDVALTQMAESLRADIDFGIQTYGVVEHPRFGRMYAYETDGFGNHRLMDDAQRAKLALYPVPGVQALNRPSVRKYPPLYA